MSTTSHAPSLKFSQDEKWSAHRLCELGTFKSGVGFPEDEQGGKVGVPFFKVSDMNLPGNERVMRTANHYVNEEQMRRNGFKPIRSKAILFAKVGAAIFQERKRIASEFLFDNNMMAFLPSSLSIDFTKHLLDTVRLSAYAQVGALPSYNASDVGAIRVHVPSLPEQQKIAAFLTVVDGRIEQLSRKKALLEEYKKGVMQQLFSQTLRFQDGHGHDFPDWEEKTLGEIATVIGGGTPESEVDEYWGGDVQWFTPTEIQSKFVCGSKRTITAKGLKNSSAKLLPPGALLFTSRATIAEVGIATRECTTNQGFQSLVVNSAASNEFVYYWIYQHKKEFLRKAQGSTFLEIGPSEMRKMPLRLPSLPEQTKIAGFLSALDGKIGAVGEQMRQTQAWKKGLLQQMFV